jgi:urease accessory protein
MEHDWLAFVLQTSDPLFPTGAYAHSFGLEEVVRLGGVRDEATLRDFLRGQIVPALENFELPFLRFAHGAAQGGDVEKLCALNVEMDAWKICRELRAASAQLGTRRLAVLLQIAPSPLLSAFAERSSRTHHVIACGIQMAGVPLDAALTTYFYQTLAGFCSAALKLIRIGQEGCQRVLRDCLTDASEKVRASLDVQRENAGWFNPMLEIASMRHERADERLFIS